MDDLIRDLCKPATGVVADGNAALFARLQQELPLVLHRWPSGDSFNGWEVPQNWRVTKAEIRKEGRLIFDGLSNTLGVARYAKSFRGTVDFDMLRKRIATNPGLPEAYVFHCMWHYRPWAADWAFAVPYRIVEAMGPGNYEIDLQTEYSPGEMLLATADKSGRSDRTIVFHSNNCHPHMANDGFAGTAVLVRLMQWLAERETNYSYRLVVGPEHLGTVFYLRDMPASELDKIVCGVFAEMPGTQGAIKIASTFLGASKLDRALAHAARDSGAAHVLVPWRHGAGNDETVWEAPGYEVPFAEVTRAESFLQPYREYHSSLDNCDLMDEGRLVEFLDVLKRTVTILEDDATMERRFDGLVCLSNPAYDLYVERQDPAVEKLLAEDQEKWGQLQDSLLRYFDGRTTILDIAERHDLPFDRIRRYLERFAEKGLVEIKWAPVTRPPVIRKSP